MPSGEEIEQEACGRATAGEVSTHISRDEYVIAINQVGTQFSVMLDRLGSKREYSIAKTKIEEAVMWAVKGLTG